MYLCMEGRGQPGVLFLGHCLPCYLKSLKPSVLVLLGSELQESVVSTYTVRGLQSVVSCAVFFLYCGFLEPN